MRFAIFLACALFALGAHASAPEPAGTIRALAVAAATGAPDDPAWQRAPVAEVALQPAFPGHPSITGTPRAQRLRVQAVRAGGRVFLKLAWSDPTANDAVRDTAQFADGAAVQFPVNSKPSTTPFMGDAQQAVNVWHWRADGRTENLVAHGFGSAARLPLGELRAAAARTGEGWEVVFTRRLHARPGEGADLRGRRTLPVAFAVWDGDNQERDGLKAVTLQWWQLRF